MIYFYMCVYTYVCACVLYVCKDLMYLIYMYITYKLYLLIYILLKNLQGGEVDSPKCSCWLDWLEQH